MVQVKNHSLSAKELLSITNAAGSQYISVHADKVLTECYAGVADIRTNAPVTKETTFNAFSITKTVTAAAILKLAEQKKILLTDNVNSMFNDFHFKYPFTVQQLLSHQAGFPDPIPISWIHLAEEDKNFNRDNFSLKMIEKNSRQKFVPGTKFSYSSIGYLLLSRIIEKVAGESYKSYLQKNILSLLSKDVSLDFRINDHAVHATGYHPRYSFSNLLLSFFLDRKKFIQYNYGSWTAFNNFYVNGQAYGGLIGNVAGLASYLQLYLSKKMFSNVETQQLMFTDQKGGMTLSWFTGTLNGQRYLCHAGGGGGYYCEIRIYPGLNMASALLRNRSSFSDLRLLNKIDSKFIR